MSVKIYTKTGDKGTTSLFGGKRVSKADLRVEAYGTIDELESMLGLSVARLTGKKVFASLVKDLQAIQLAVMEIGVALANPKDDRGDKEEKYFLEEITTLEKRIDEMTAKLPELRNFIALGGSELAAYLFIIRAVCRRAERRIVALDKKEPIPEYLLKYCNRLSDYLFTAGRFVNHKEKKKEPIWISVLKK